MQLRLPWAVGHASRARVLEIDGRVFPVEVRRRRGARRYIVRVAPDGVVHLTVPYGASIASGLSFAGHQAGWIGREWQRLRTRLEPWNDGTLCWFRGARVPIHIADGRVRLSGDDAGACEAGGDVRAVVTTWLRGLAAAELPARCAALSDLAGLRVARVSVRNQKSRWGACSPRGSITLNWRLVQVPEAIRDYVIWHELAHLAVPNHSRRFWREVERLCPTWRADEHWLKAHEREIL